MDYRAEYDRWRNRVTDSGLKAELEEIANKEEEIKERFSSALVFGTAGLRGVLGAGLSRMNLYTVRCATQGLAEYVVGCFGEGCVAIAYDSRHQSREFAEACASVLAANQVRVWLYDRLMPTPMLSFAVRELGARAGIMITASHNPARYNGYKVYGADGCQMTPEDTQAVASRIEKVDLFDGVRSIDFRKGLAEGLIHYIGTRTIERYYRAVENQQIYPGIVKKHGVKVLYTPLHGAGNEPVRRVLEDIGVKELAIVKQQELPDGDFPTAPYPNPETEEAMAVGLAECKKIKADLLIATDPDADRMGVAVREHDGYRLLTGNEVGVLLLYYMIAGHTEQKTMPQDPIAFRSVVSTRLADKVAETGGVEMRTVLTGFKYIGEQILMLEQQGQQERFLFGFEESCGYLTGSYVRDKDAVVASMLLCEFAAWCNKKHTTAAALLDGLYQKYGYYRTKVVNIEFAGLRGNEEMQAIMERLYVEVPKEIAGLPVSTVTDYRAGIHRSLSLGVETAVELPSADIIGYTLENGALILIRPSGTEPKMKIYITAKEKTAEASEDFIKAMEAAAKELIRQP